MTKQRKRSPAKTTTAIPVIQPDAAGLDVGATEVYVAVPSDRSDQPVQAFPTFTEDLERLADWLSECGVRTIAMESTGVYWIPVAQILEKRGFEVNLVNARHLKNVSGRKSDVSDCQWLQYLHAVGLLSSSFRPKDAICALRGILRHRDTQVGYASQHVQHMQKALTQMNLKLHHVISDLTGKTGMAIMDAILLGERNPVTLSKLRDPRIKASEEVIQKALTGDWRTEHLFTLRQALESYRHYVAQIAVCDAEIERRLLAMGGSGIQGSPPPKKGRDRVQGMGVNLPTANLRDELYRLNGVDLTAIDGLGATSVHAIFAEIGSDLSMFRTAGHFSSWMGLCPDNQVSGGKRLSVGTRHVKNNVAQILRICAQSLHHSDSALGAFFRKMRTKLGTPKAITATAHRLARIIYHMLTTKEPFDESKLRATEERQEQARMKRLQREAKSMGYTLQAMAS